MIDSTDLCFTPATELAEMIRRKTVSPVEVIDALLARIEQVNPQVNAFCTVTGEGARAEAQAMEAALMRGEYRFEPGLLRAVCPPRVARTASGRSAACRFRSRI